METKESWAAYFKRTEKRYFLLFLFLSVLLLSAGGVYGIQEPANFVMARVSGNLHKVCLEEFPKEACDYQTKMLLETDFSQEIRDAQHRKKGAAEKLHKKLLLASLTYVVKGKDFYQESCSRKIEAKTPSVAEADRTRLCLCLGQGFGKRLDESVWNEEDSIEKMQATIIEFEKQAGMECLGK